MTNPTLREDVDLMLRVLRAIITGPRSSNEERMEAIRIMSELVLGGRTA